MIACDFLFAREPVPVLLGVLSLAPVTARIMIEAAQQNCHVYDDVFLPESTDVGKNAGASGRRWCAEGVRSREIREIERILRDTSQNILDVHRNRVAESRAGSDVLQETIRALVTTLEGKDSYTWGHSNRVAELARLTAWRMGLGTANCERIYTAGLLHDVGKLGIPDTVLNKADRLSRSEYNLIRLHPVIGFEIVQRVRSLAEVAPAVLYHHEAIDGSGYPDGLVDQEIPLDARILGVADAFDAMTSARSYRSGMAVERAEAILRDGAGRQWDRECVQAFFAATDGVRLSVCTRSNRPSQDS